MPYKFKSVLKSFQYSTENYQIISDFLIDGLKSNPDILLNVTKISKEFGKRPNDWFANPTTVEFIKALFQVKIENQDRKFIIAFKKWLKDEKSITRFSGNSKNSGYIDVLKGLNQKEIIKLAKFVKAIVVKRGNAELTKAISGTWIHRDLAVKYAEWLDPKFSIWISKKIQELVSDGISWNELRDLTKMDYKPLTLAIKTHIVPLHPKLDDNIVYGKIANYINCRVIGKKAKEIRDEKGIEPHELTRDFFTKEQLDQIEKVQVFAEILISQFDIYDFQTLHKKILKYKL
jgi:hypothetical protein